MRLDLQPVARAPSLQVPRVEPLGHDPLELLRLGRVAQRLPVRESLRQPHDAAPAVEELLEPPLALAQRELDERLAVELEQVEDVEDERTGALLHRREARAATVVECADLAVKDGVRALRRLHDLLRHRLEAGGEVVAVPRDQPALAAAHVRERPVAVPLDLERPAVATRDVRAERRRHDPVLGGRLRIRCLLVAALDQEPVLVLPVELRRDERPRPVQPLPAEADRQLAVALLLQQVVRAVIPDLDHAGPVLALRDLAVELRVLERVVLHVDGERPAAGLERDALRDRPRRERAVPLEAEVVVEPPGVVPLDDEDRALPAPAAVRERLGRLLRVALAPVLGEAHLEASLIL